MRIVTSAGVELLRALAVLAEPPRPEHAPIRAALAIVDEPDAAGHTDLFTFQLVPYASAYLNSDGMLGGDVRDRIAGFWHALREAAPAEPDSLQALLGLYAGLQAEEDAASDAARRLMIGRARAALLWEHLAPWAFVYAGKAAQIAAPFYRSWARLLSAGVACAVADADALDHLPVHLSLLPAMPDPREAGAEEFLAALLAPARSGIVLTRADLRRAAEKIGLGLRQGERRYILRSMLGQDAPGTLQWLEREARREARGHTASSAPPAIRAHWAARAGRTAALLRELRATTT
jgi:TorA maturation chaperone TorD